MKNNDTRRVILEPAGISYTAQKDQSLLEIVHASSLELRTDCGGKGACGKCKVFAFPGEHLSEHTSKELEVLTPQEIAQGVRLACQTQPLSAVTVTVPEYSLDGGKVVGKTKMAGTYPVRAAVERFFVKDGAAGENGGSDDLINQVIQRMRGPKSPIPFLDVQALRDLSQPSVYEENLTLVCHRTRGITAVLPGHQQRSLGLAMDIGTTTLAVYLCDLGSGTVLSAAAAANPQRRFGEDVISRIAFADKQQDGLQILHRLIIAEINLLISQCLAEADAKTTDVDEVAVAGNPTMEHLFAAFHPHSLGRAPYLPVSRFPGTLRAGDVGLDLNPAVNVYLLPLVSGFVGGDTVAVILADKPHERDEVSLIVDIGTNGEVVLGNRRGLFVTSCATGPAFEGAQIACGMRAVAGAIHRLAIDPDTCSVSWHLIGTDQQSKPKGICGSGIIDAIAEMGRAGLLLSSGRIKEGMPGVIADSKNIGRQFTLVPAEKSATGREIAITLADIRQIQLAKAALYSGISLLMEKARVDHIDRMMLTGAFGARFNWRNAVAIGMLPGIRAGSSSIENAAGIGAIMALLDHSCRTEAKRLTEQIHALELSMAPDFCTVFPMSMQFPF